MIGRCRTRSTATPWAFIETSIAPLDAPSTISASGSSHGSGASRGSGSTSAQTTPVIRVERTLPSRTIAWPMIGSATITPIAIPRMIRPSVLLEKSKRSWTHGMWPTQVPMTAPFTKNTPKVAVRGVMPGPRSRPPPRSPP